MMQMAVITTLSRFILAGFPFSCQAPAHIPICTITQSFLVLLPGFACFIEIVREFHLGYDEAYPLSTWTSAIVFCCLGN